VANPAFEIIQDAVNRIMAAMKEGRFSKEDLETIKKVFKEGVKATDLCLARGPKKGDVDDKESQR
jgi:hypothetical protein